MFFKQNYNPTFFLAALWHGWLSVTFFMYLMFIIPRDSEKNPIPTFDTLVDVWIKGDLFFQILIIVSIFWIIFFAFNHIIVLVQNLKQFFEFKQSSWYKKLKNSNAEISLMAMPLTLAMTINVLFILGAVFIPWLWSYVEYLFPWALIAFLLVWILALSIFMDYFIRLILKHTDADFVNNNSLSQMLSVFAFTMVWVGFAASAAMSNVKLTIFLWLAGSIFFITIAVFLLLLKLTLWFKSILEKGIDKAASPSLWMIIPITTLIWITFIRQSHWLHDFWAHSTNADYMVLTLIIFSLQMFFWYIWYKVMKSNSYFDDFIDGKEKNPWSYALICPWVALTVFAFFFLHLWLVKNWLVDKFSISYFLLLLPILYLQIKTIIVMFKLNKKLF